MATDSRPGERILALDQGTTSSRAVVFDGDGLPVATAQEEFPQHLRGGGGAEVDLAIVEHDPEDLWRTTLGCAREALARAGGAGVAAIGITNQRETTILWERSTGRPVAPAIVWQSRVSAPICQRLRDAGLEPEIRRRTGLLLDPYFSATKIVHLLETVPGLRAACERGEVLFGTVDSFLIWRLTGGRVHATDPLICGQLGAHAFGDCGDFNFGYQHGAPRGRICCRDEEPMPSPLQSAADSSKRVTTKSVGAEPFQFRCRLRVGPRAWR